MKSNKQRRLEIKARRRDRAEAAKNRALYPQGANQCLRIKADHDKLNHNSYYCELPLFYVNKAFKCRACGSAEIWTAKKQQWWYEVAKGRIESTAIYCRDCRINKKREKEVLKTRMAELATRKPHPHEAFFKKTYE